MNALSSVCVSLWINQIVECFDSSCVFSFLKLLLVEQSLTERFRVNGAKFAFMFNLCPATETYIMGNGQRGIF